MSGELILLCNVTQRNESCTLEVPYIAWGMKNPSNFLLKVKPVVNIEMETGGAIQVPK
jgi:hypothetical protein